MKKLKKMNNKGFSLIELIIVIAIMAVLVAVIAPNLTSYIGNSKKKTDNSNADSIEGIINTQLQNYGSDDDITAMANTEDDAMTAYETVQELLEAGAGAGDPADPYTSIFEKNVLDNIPEKYYDVANSYQVNTKQDSVTFWLKIEGTKDEGFSATVKCSADDPFTR